MLFAFAALACAYPLSGRWIGKYSSSMGEEVDFSMKFRAKNVRFVGRMKAPKNRMLPKRVDIREIRQNQTFLIMTPGVKDSKFAQIDLTENTADGMIGKATSFDGVYDVSLTVSDDNIRLELYQKKRGRWFRYDLLRGSQRPIAFPVALTIFGILGVGTISLLYWTFKKVKYTRNPKKD